MNRFSSLSPATDFISRGILAGICIGLAGTTYLKVSGVIGACLFAFGLIAVITTRLNLFTGKAQYVWNPRHGGYPLLVAMLLLNIFGCFIAAYLLGTPQICSSATDILILRLDKGTLSCGFLSIFCGMIMTLAVRNASSGNWLPLLFGIPTFILCGLPHCIADAFYICAADPQFLISNSDALIEFYIAIVTGNFIGCNLYRLVSAGDSFTRKIFFPEQ